MKNNNAKIFREIGIRFKGAQKEALRGAAMVAQEFFKEGFKKGGQQLGAGVKPWDKRKHNLDISDKTRQTLVKRGILANSIQIKSSGLGRYEIYSNKPQALLLNDGGTIKVTARMRKFFWAMYYKNLSKLTYNISTKSVNGGATGKRREGIAEIWKNLAFAKELKFSPRPIMYDSPVLAERVGNFLFNFLNKRVFNK